MTGSAIGNPYPLYTDWQCHTSDTLTGSAKSDLPNWYTGWQCHNKSPFTKSAMESQCMKFTFVLGHAKRQVRKTHDRCCSLHIKKKLLLPEHWNEKQSIRMFSCQMVSDFFGVLHKWLPIVDSLDDYLIQRKRNK